MALAPRRGNSVLRTRHIYVVVCGGKMAALGDTTALGVNGLIRQFTAITGKIFFRCGPRCLCYIAAKQQRSSRCPPDRAKPGKQR